MSWLIESTNTTGARFRMKYKSTKNYISIFQVPKAASTSWTSLLLSDRQFADVKHKIGQQHTYLRSLHIPISGTIGVQVKNATSH